MFLMKAYADAGSWVTINGTHVLIGASGKIVKGPAKFIGSTIEEISNKSELETPSNKSGGRISLTKDAEDYGWTQKDIDYLNSKLSPNASLTWVDDKSGKKIRIEVTDSNGKTLPLASIQPSVGLRGQNQFSVAGKVGGYFDKEHDYSTMGRAVSAINKSIGYKPESPINPNKAVSPMAQRYAEGFNRLQTRDVGSRAKVKATTPKYPSGIATPAQKRAYTRAINSGKSASEAKASALGKSTTANSKGVKTSSSSKMSNSDIKKMSTETLLRTHNDLQSKMTVAGFNGDKKSMRRYESESLRLFEEYSKRISRGE